MIKNIRKVLFSVNALFLLAFIVVFHATSFAQKGLLINGGSIVIANASGAAPYIYVTIPAGGSGSLSDCDFTNQSDSYGSGALGSVKPIGIGGTIHIGGDWSNKCNNGVFSADGVTTIMDGTNTEDVGPTTGSGGYTTKFYNLTLGGTGLKSLQVDTWVGGFGTLTGQLDIASRTLDLNQHTLTIKNSASTGITRSSGLILSETNSSVNPSIIKWEMNTATGPHVFPFGASGDYIPFTFDKVSSTGSDISVSTRATSAPDNLPWAGVSSVAAVTTMNKNGVDGSTDYVIDRWWDINSSTNPLVGGGAQLTFSYRGAENTLTVNPTGPIDVQHWDGTTWEAKVAGGAAGVVGGTGSVATGIAQTKFSPYILVGEDNPLPVELLNYTANCNGNNVLIKWSTTSETKKTFYTVEKSYNGVDYEEVVTNPSKGSVASVNNYEFVDDNTMSGNCYYRLRETDFDGKARILATVSSNCGPKDFEIINLYNKSNEELKLSYKIEDDESFNFNLYNAIGQQIIAFPYKSVKGLNEVSFDISNLSYGIYFLVMKNDTHAFTRKLVISK